jgi:CheY-like chemotaxis protein
MKLPSSQKLHVLLVEDSDADAMLIKRSFTSSDLSCSLYWLKDGESAIAYLERRGQYKQAIRPDLIILDLNLPRLDGREVLHRVKNNSALKRIPVVVMSTSNSEQDISRSYDLNANCYIVKPFDVHDFLRVTSSIKEFWLRNVALSPL